MAARAASLGAEVCFIAQVPPGLTDDGATIGAREGNRWHDQTANAFYLCSSASTGAAVWQRIAQPGVEQLASPMAVQLGSAAYVSLTAIRSRYSATHNAAYQVVSGDWQRLLITTSGTNTWTLPLATDVENGFWFAWKNRSGNNLTFAPTGTDQINGVNATVAFATGLSGLVTMTGTGFETH